MRILFVSHSPLLHGAERSLYELVHGIRVLGAASPTVVFPFAGPLMEKIDDLGIPVVVMPYSRWASKREALHRRLESVASNGRAVHRFRHLFDLIRPDLVVTNTVTVPSAAIAAYSSGVPHLWYVREYADPTYDVSFHLGPELSFRLIGRFSERVVVNSQHLARYISRWIPKERLRVVYPAVDAPYVPAPKMREDGHSPRRLVVIGYQVSGKGQEDAVRALAELREGSLPVTLTFIGSENPDYGGYLRRLAKELDVEEAVTFAGHVPDPLAMIRDAVVVVCSRREGFGRVAIEAMKCGRPVIAAGSETAKEFIRDNWNGLTYRVGDARDLAKQVESIFEDQELRVRIANTGQQWAMKTFTTERHVREFMAVASEAVDGKVAGGMRPSLEAPSHMGGEQQ